MKKMKLTIIMFCFSSLVLGDISGVSYFSFSEDGFELKRTYFTYKSQISEDLSFKFQTDIGSNSPVDNRWIVYLKKAQLDWKVNDGMKMSMGMIGMNMFNIQEKTWGNRFLSKSALDLAGWSSSADLGIGFYKNYGKLSTSLLLTNGEGHKNSDVDGKNKVSLQAVYGEKRLDKNAGYNFGLVYSTLDPDPGEAQKVQGIFGGWSNGTALGGIEVYTMQEGDIDAFLMSLSVNYALTDNLTMFVRQDNEDPNTENGTSADEEDLTMAGFIWSPAKGLKICPNVPDLNASNPTFRVNFEFKF